MINIEYNVMPEVITYRVLSFRFEGAILQEQRT